MKNENKKSRYILPLFIVFILVASAFGIIFSSPSQDSSESYKHKGLLFTKRGEDWTASIQGAQLYLSYGPRDLNDLDVNINVYDLLKAKKVYYSVNGGESLGNCARVLFNVPKPGLRQLT